ncbi:MAG: choice-of-anchor L domain-containing protein, partial [Myxococcales bacterium]|nr:choice-of-anchor L domain-containing protein [Myxococcales bacterium]
KAGTQTCNQNGTGWGACEGEVLPLSNDICANNKDDNCDGVVDEDPDADNDGYTVCGGDCCDSVGPACQTPNLVNPGAFEVDGNDVDDDCDGVKDNPVPVCDNGIASNTQNALDYAKAIDLCQFTTENAQGVNKIWGVISGSITQPSGNDGESNNGHSVRNGFGSNITNSKGQRLAVLSSGHAADINDTNPNYAAFESGVNTGPDQTAPSDWLAANGNSFPNAPGCSISNNTNANDGQMVKLRVRVPTNANSFTVKFFFFSAEYPEYVCTSFNDFFVTLVDSNDNGNPNDKNIAIYVSGNNQWPVGVNLVSAAPGLFAVCDNGNIGCAGGPNVPYNGCSQGENLLTGTGFDLNASACANNDDVGGGTGWLVMSGNVTPGETMEIRFAIWDTGDSVWDSLVLLDHWEWSVQASEPGIMPG